MHRRARPVAIALTLAAVGIVPTSACAATTAQANAKARAVAARYVTTMGIHYTAPMWSTACALRTSSWFCRVGTDGVDAGQCFGSLRLSRQRLGPYSIRIGCAE